MTVGITVSLVLGTLMGFFMGRSGHRLLRDEVQRLRRDVDARESHLKVRSERDAALLRAAMHKLEIHPTDEGPCRTQDRSMKRVAQLLQQRKSAQQKRDEQWEKAREEQFGAEVADDGNG